MSIADVRSESGNFPPSSASYGGNFGPHWLLRYARPDASGEVITFYSYKGGTGRSLALANCVGLLAESWPISAKPILLIDFDLEAPGLHQYLRHYLPAASSLQEQGGTLELFTALLQAVERELQTRTAQGARTTTLDEASCQALLAKFDFTPYLISSTLNKVWLIKAGRFDDRYTERLSAMQWQRLYELAPGIFRALATHWSQQYACTLIDARTGLSDTSSICTMLLPDVLTVVFTLNRQSLTGIEHLVRTAKNYRDSSSDLRPLRIYPLPSRVDNTSDMNRQIWRFGQPEFHPVFGEVIGYQPLFTRLFGEIFDTETAGRNLDDGMHRYFEIVQVPHNADYAFGERLSFGPQAATDRFSLRTTFESFLLWLTSAAPPWRAPSEYLMQIQLEDWLAAMQPPQEDDNEVFAAWINQIDSMGQDGLWPGNTAANNVLITYGNARLQPDLAALLPRATLVLTINLMNTRQWGKAGSLFERLCDNVAEFGLPPDWARVPSRWLQYFQTKEGLFGLEKWANTTCFDAMLNWIDKSNIGRSHYREWQDQVLPIFTNFHSNNLPKMQLERQFLLNRIAVLGPQIPDLHPTQARLDELTASLESITGPAEPFIRAHAFIIVPFNNKAGPDGQPIHFNRIYQDLFVPALEEAGFTVFRADDQRRAGDILADMYQKLLMADLVLVDVTLDNPNVWYELGVCHALRARGAIQVYASVRTSLSHNLYANRGLRYRLKNGAPDPKYLAEDRTNLRQAIQQSWEVARKRKVSPVYQLLPHLQEPAWREFLLDGSNEFSEHFHAWENRLKVARRKFEVGDLLVLADESPTIALQVEARRSAGNALMALEHHHFALEQFDAALKLDPQDKASREKRIVCLGRIGKREEARQAAAALVRDHPNDPETLALCGRIEKEEWIEHWRTLPQEQRRAAAANAVLQLNKALAYYEQAYGCDANHYYSGINALTLSLLQRDLTGTSDAARDELATNIAGGVRWAIERELRQDKQSYWACASLAEYCLLKHDVATVRRAYQQAVSLADKDRFALDSTRQTVRLLADLQFRPAETAAALAVLDTALAKLAPPFVPRKVFLFSGHMVDSPTRPEPRFPQTKVEAAKTKMAEILDRHGAGPEDFALTQGAAGGDLIFADACIARGVRLRLQIPFQRDEFVSKSILPSQDGAQYWVPLFARVQNSDHFTLRQMPDELGPVPANGNAFARCNLWLLNTALAYGISKVHFICLWDGAGGDGPGGTAHMCKAVQCRTGQVDQIDPGQL